MRTTLTIDDDVLLAAKAMAKQQHRSLGKVISELVRNALYGPQPGTERNGIPLLPTRTTGAVVSVDLVNALQLAGGETSRRFINHRWADGVFDEEVR